MGMREKLFFSRDPYKAPKDGRLFIKCVLENLNFQIANCPEYAAICEHFNFKPELIKSEEDLWRIPPVTTNYLKRNNLFSMSDSALKIKVTSSGTGGSKSTVGFDKKSLSVGIGMMIHYFNYYHVLSPMPVNYIVLGYEPSSHNDMGAAKTAYGTTFFAPALRRDYALKATENGYEPDIEGLAKALYRAEKSPFPVRFVGFPPYMYFLVKYLEEHGMSFKLKKGSKILLGGGWKQFSGEEIGRKEFFGLIGRTLGITDCLEFFSAVEHPLPYVKCENGRFHVPRFSRVLVRDPKTLEPLPYGRPGIINFISPLVMSMPILSIMTDDLAVLYPGEQCGCGNGSDCFELLGRVGARNVKTCAAEASKLILNGR